VTGRNKKLDSLFAKAKTWREVKQALRAILLEFPFEEELKWRQPCYRYEGSNVVLISGFKDYCALAFLRGALLKDPKGRLQAPGDHSQAMRQLRFTSAEEVQKNAKTIRSYVKNAIDVQKKGLKVDFKARKALELPDELVAKFDDDPDLRAAFEALTPGRQRGWLLHFTGAKQSKTRTARIEKAADRIFAGQGIHDR
jgi:uncharacterized protein YdeI (YjbR/CyaY-like superfamily)